MHRSDLESLQMEQGRLDLSTPVVPASPWQFLLRSRWWLGGAIGLAFAVGHLLEALFFERVLGVVQVSFDAILWGILGALAVWFSLTWTSRQEQRHQSELEQALQQQQLLNRQLQRANAHLTLLSEANAQLAVSASLDAVAAAALEFPRRLAPSEMAALWLFDPGGEVLACTTGQPPKTLHTLRAAYGHALAGATMLQIITPPNDPDGLAGACLVLPLYDDHLMVGRMEFFLARRISLAEDEYVLLQTIAGEIAETISGVRRRAREERAIYELEQAIAEERARIARDIHDGLAQTLAFRRMRVDLWLDWLDQDPARLRSELVSFKHLLREQIAELRRAIFALRPLTFDEFGFVGGMHRYVQEFGSQQNWQVDVDLSSIASLLSPTLEAICFRIIQEALTNAAKHARATTVSVSSAVVDGGLQFVIQDNGRGFDPGGLANSGDGTGARLGLRQMRERLAALHGRLTVLSHPGAGAELRVWIPLDAVRRQSEQQAPWADSAQQEMSIAA
jgi:signal transduction histidine kinase